MAPHRVEAAEALTQAEAALAAHGEAEQAAGKDLVLAEAREQALRESEAYKSAQTLAREREVAAVAETAAAFARTQAAEAETALADARRQVEKAANDVAAEQKRLAQTLAQVQAAAERGRFLALHTATVAVKDGDPLAALVALGEAQLARIDEIVTKLAETETLQRLAVEAENAQAERETAREKAEEAHEQAQEQLAEQREALLEAIDQWAESSEPLDREGAFQAALRQAVQNSPFGEEMPALGETLDRLLAPLREQARAEQALCNHRLAEIGSERAEAEKRLQALQEKQLPPPAPPLRGDERDGRLGAPFWQLIEFRDETDRAARAGIEAALQAAGLLDAWVNPDGTLGPEQDGFLVAAAPVGRALAELLQVDDSADAVPAAQVERLLASIALDETGTTTVGADGSFTLGLLRGRAVKAEPQFIGASAREGHRRQGCAALDTPPNATTAIGCIYTARLGRRAPDRLGTR